MRIIVLGAGVVGVTSAWYLREAGHEVVVVDRQAAAGLETSFANGGQISVSHAEPWANPHAPLKALHWLMQEDAPLLFRLRADPAQWRWGLRFLLECTPSRTRRNISALVKLGVYSRQTLQALRRDTGIHYDELEKGILHFYTSEAEFEAAQGPARLMREFGCEIDMLGPEDMVRIEPALGNARPRLVGGSLAPRDESGDAHRFTQALAQLAAERGVQFRYGTTVRALSVSAGVVDAVLCTTAEGDQTMKADAYLVALGSYSSLLLNPLGLRLDVYPAKGYSATLPVVRADLAYSTSLTDDEYKIVYSRLGNRLRIAGTAELTGYDTSLNSVRCQLLVRRLQSLFPGAADPAQAEFWAGLRPSTPSNVPCIGATRYRKLYVNTGHGTLGWTHSCGSGRAIADLVSGRRPDVDFPFMLS